MALPLAKGQTIDREDLLRALTRMQYARNNMDFRRGTFRARGDVIEVFPAYEDEAVIRIEMFGDEIESLLMVNPLRGEVLSETEKTTIYPANHYVAPEERLQKAIITIQAELEERLEQLKKAGKLLEAQRLEQRTRHDLEMLRATGVCNGIENYSRHLDGRKPGEPPFTLLHYFPEDWIVFVDESHVAVPQVGGMYRGDRSRKETLVEHGFRLPSALDNRPLRMEEWEGLVSQIVYVSATPSAFEMEKSKGHVAEQIVRPTGLLDPEIEVKPARTQVDDLLAEVRAVAKKGFRTLVTTLTKRSAEELTNYYAELGVRVKYLHSEIDAIERVAILRDLRLGEFDVLVGINLLREGLDLPEVALVAILDADKEGFLRSEGSLIQTMGRAARNVHGKAILYADKRTDSMRAAMEETARRRAVQESYNAEHDITPETIRRALDDLMSTPVAADYSTVPLDEEDSEEIFEDHEALIAEIARLDKVMRAAANRLDFEAAAGHRDRIRYLETKGVLA
jgi:excinuclease ABC subunit B